MSPLSVRDVAEREDCPPYFRVGGVLYSRNRQRMKALTRGMSGRQKVRFRKALRREQAAA